MVITYLWCNIKSPYIWFNLRQWNSDRFLFFPFDYPFHIKYRLLFNDLNESNVSVFFPAFLKSIFQNNYANELCLISLIYSNKWEFWFLSSMDAGNVRLGTKGIWNIFYFTFCFICTRRRVGWRRFLSKYIYIVHKVNRRFLHHRRFFIQVVIQGRNSRLLSLWDSGQYGSWILSRHSSLTSKCISVF